MTANRQQTASYVKVDGVVDTSLPPQAPSPSPPTTACSAVRRFCDDCGIAPITVRGADTRIVNGDNASPGEYPYQVFVRIQFLTSASSCGGSIIKRRWILSAAHCFFLSNTPIRQVSATVGIGSHLRSGLTSVPVARIIVHPSYNPLANDFHDDIALIELVNDLPYANDPLIQPICLGLNSDYAPGTKAVVTGWGRLDDGLSAPNNLQEVVLDVISRQQCATLNIQLPNNNNVICTFTPSKDVCKGDSGGPMVVQLCDGRWAQIGIVSFGRGCAEPNTPSVYTSVPAYTDWIIANTGSNTC